MKRIAIYNIKPEMILAKEVYSRDGRLLLRKGSALNQEWVDKLADYGIPTVYVEGGSAGDEVSVEGSKPAKGMKELKRMYQGNVPDMITIEVREEAERVVQEIMQDVKTGRLIKTNKTRKVVENIVTQLINNRHIVGKLADIRILDDYTFAHSVNVCILSISTGIIMGYSKIRLRELGIGALLHDVGKMRIPDEILNKRGPLTEKEFEEIKRHTILGYELLSEHPDITSNAARISIQHHECYNGSGYPWGVRDEEVHEYSKIVAIADVYDALTADRVYKNAILPYEAMEIIIASSGYQFDPKTLRLFVENSEIYPVGSTVELSTGDVGMVVNVNRALPTRPVVKLIIDADGKDITKEMQIDLMNNTTIFVKKILSFRKKAGL
ncbi:MAG: HD-GYP domain-containing protein [Eubacteriales bacterium]